jgi:predicted AlkP superfamily pyrophosphatase or phosphodiesterase
MTRFGGITGRLCATFVLLFVLRGCEQKQPALPVIAVEHGPNAGEQRQKPYVVLVSLDGFRYDYAQKYGAPNLLAIASRGATAPDGMIPAYPSVTFPNHYTIVTGLYPEHHGIVANSFYDPGRKQVYNYTDPKTATDGSWYGGTPLWTLAENQGMRSACFFWPGSEAEIAGQRPSYYLKYDDKVPDEDRIDQVIAWLRLPAATRPHFITLYYPDTDHAGHQFGPDSPEESAAVHHVDELMGHLETKLNKLHLPVDLIIVADHGMETLQGGWINLDRWADLRDFVTDGALMYAKNDAAAEKAYEQLKGASDKFNVYRQCDVPANLHYNNNPRIGDPVVILNGPYWVRAKASANPNDKVPDIKGMHGYDPYRFKTMRAIFYAEGPDIRRGATVEPFENVNLYPFIARILGLSIGPVDGDLKVLQGILQQPRPEHALELAPGYVPDFAPANTEKNAAQLESVRSAP